MNICENNEIIHFAFKCNKTKQKHLIEILLTYSKLDLKTLASSLDVTISFLIGVVTGTCFLEMSKARQLAELFLLFFGE